MNSGYLENSFALISCRYQPHQRKSNASTLLKFSFFGMIIAGLLFATKGMAETSDHRLWLLIHQQITHAVRQIGDLGVMIKILRLLSVFLSFINTNYQSPIR